VVGLHVPCSRIDYRAVGTPYYARAVRKALVTLFLALVFPATASGATTRLIYASDWTGLTELFAIRPAGGAPLGQLTSGVEHPCITEFFACGFADPSPSPDGRWLLYRNALLLAEIPAQGQSLWLARADGTGARLVTSGGGEFVGPAAWAPNSRRFAYVTSAGIWVARRDGRGAHTVSAVVPRSLSWSPDSRSLAALAYPEGPSDRPGRLTILRGAHPRVLATVAGASVDWSPNGRWLAVSSTDAMGPVALISAANGRRRRAIGSGSDARWSPKGGYLASATAKGLLLMDTQTGRTRLLTTDTAYRAPDAAKPLGFAWAPDGRSIAYVTTRATNDFIAQGDLKVVTLSGRARTVVAGSSAHGGRILSVAWTRAPTSPRYSRPRVTATGLIADGPVLQLATDGPSIAFGTTCNRVSVWEPSTNFLFTTGQAPLVGVGPDCDWSERWDLYTVALAGDRLVYGFNEGGLSSFWSLRQLTISAPASGVQLDGAFGPLGGPWRHALGTAVGSGSLVVYSVWDEANVLPASPFQVTEQTIVRAEPSGCPCPALAASPGPLVPYDVADDHIVASADFATVVYDRNGRQLLSLPIAALGAQLDGADVVVLVQRELRDYDLHSGRLLHASPLPDVGSGSECASPHYCDRTPPRLLLEDARGGLVTYVLDGEVHIRRLVDGADAVVAPGSRARFFDGGLVYVSGARLSVVPYDQLPLRGD
jgi:Tol biopolymer transport system component